MLLCKDKNFKANHNNNQVHPNKAADVCYYAKIRILKQITTVILYFPKEWGCLLLCKDKNFKANHNEVVKLPAVRDDVCYYAKIRILKQITTCSCNDRYRL